MSSLHKQSEATQIRLSQVQGAHAELAGFTEAQILPGIDHEKLEDRRKAMESQIQAYTYQLQQFQGAIQETAYWIHQTMGGQEPSEAILQLKKLEQSEAVAEGPITDLEELQHNDGENGYHGLYLVNEESAVVVAPI